MMIIMKRAGKMKRYSLLEVVYHLKVWCDSWAFCDTKANLAESSRLCR